MPLSITVGEGKNRPQGKLLQLESATVEALAQALDEQPSRFERWWSTHTWEKSYRLEAKWLGSCGVAVDLDHCDKTKPSKEQHCAPSPEVAKRLADLVHAGAIPGNLFHATPRGARVVFVFPEPARDRAQMLLAMRGAGALVALALADAELFSYEVDQGALEDLARLFFSPRAVVAGVTRDAHVEVMRSEPWPLAELAGAAPPPLPLEPVEPAPRAQAARPKRPAASIDDAVARFNADHPLELPRSDGDCPVCGHRGCWGQFPDKPSRWACFSTNHDGVGVRGQKCWHGDALDIAAHEARIDRMAVLRRDGYLPTSAPRSQPPHPADMPLGAEPSGGAAVLQMPAPSTERVTLRLTAEEHELNLAAIEALGGHPKVFQRTGQLVRVSREVDPARSMTRPQNTPTISALPQSVLRSHLTEVVQFEKWLKSEDRHVPDHPWDWLVRAVHEFGEWPGVRHLEAVVEAPVIRPDGSLLDKPGYDPATGVLYEPNCGVPLVSAKPSQAEAQRAAHELLDLVGEFPFASDAHRAAWVASLLTPLCRMAISSPSPLFAIDANVRAAGKSKLADCVSVILTGRPMARMVYSGEDEEMRKRILSIALAGDRMVLMDNIVGSFGGPALDAVLTGLELSERLTGTPRMVRVPLMATWFATGNNIQMVGDLARRTLAVRLESPEEHPEERKGFKYPDLLAHASAERTRYLSCALTILRGFCEAGRPKQGLKPWGSFESWSDLVRDAIVWAGMADPGETRAALAAGSDSEAGGLAALLNGWRELDPRGEGVTAAGALDRLRGDLAGAGRGEHTERFRTLRSALMEICPGHGGDLPSPRSLGKHLAKFRGRACNGWRFEARTATGLLEWFAVSTSGFGASGGSVTPGSQQIPLIISPVSLGNKDTKPTKATTGPQLDEVF